MTHFGSKTKTFHQHSARTSRGACLPQPRLPSPVCGGRALIAYFTHHLLLVKGAAEVGLSSINAIQAPPAHLHHALPEGGTDTFLPVFVS